MRFLLRAFSLTDTHLPQRLRSVKDVHEVGPGGITIEARMQTLREQTAADLKECANVCDTYTKKRLLVRVLKGQIWQAKLVDWIAKFTSRKADFEFALSVHTARAVDGMSSTVNVIDTKWVLNNPSFIRRC